jgi:hypothetical protein
MVLIKTLALGAEVVITTSDQPLFQIKRDVNYIIPYEEMM